MFAFQIFLIRKNIYMRIIFTDKNSILYTQEKSEILENTNVIKILRYLNYFVLFIIFSQTLALHAASEINRQHFRKPKITEYS